MRRRSMLNAEDNSFPIGTTTNFAYTGSYQEIDLPKGSYKLQCWGALGGSNASASSYSITAKSGGKGGYSEGIITIPYKTTVRVYVGGQGGSSSGGYNGGGSTTGTASYTTGTSGQAGYLFGYSKMGGGGGATDIRLSDGSLYSRFIVAGGGSGGAMCYSKVTSSSTTWDSSLSFTNEAQWVYTSGSNTWYITELYINGWSPGDYIRFKVSFPSNVFLTQMVWRVNNVDTGHTKLTSGSYTYKTIPSGCTNIRIQVFNTTGVTEYVPYSSITSRSAGKQVASTSTSTNNYSLVGFVGGGTNGGGYSSTYYGKQNAAGSGGSFGLGANLTITNYRYCSAGGGGGWYGGGGGSYSDSSTTYCKYSGGGSGFVNTSANSSYRPSSYTGLQLDSGTTYAGNTSFTSTSGSTETGHSGNGYARITRLS